VAEAFMYRHEPLTRAVAELVRDGAVGAARLIASGFTYAQSRPADVRLDPALGGGAMLDVGCYPVSYACLLFGHDATSATGLVRLTSRGVDEEVAGTLGFSGGRAASVYAGFRAAYRTWLEITGTEGWMRVPHPFTPGPLETIEIERLGERRRLEVRGSDALFVRQVSDFVATVVDGAPPVMPLAESRRVAAALSLLRKAVQEVAS
jgi:predicted dehydrogenase